MKGKDKKDIVVNSKDIDARREKAARDALVNWLDYEKKMMVEAAGAAAGEFYPKNNLK